MEPAAASLAPGGTLLIIGPDTTNLTAESVARSLILQVDDAVIELGRPAIPARSA